VSVICYLCLDNRISVLDRWIHGLFYNFDPNGYNNISGAIKTLKITTV